ncbi:60S ribosomal protein L28 [Lemmus lemmus]
MRQFSTSLRIKNSLFCFFLSPAIIGIGDASVAVLLKWGGGAVQNWCSILIKTNKSVHYSKPQNLKVGIFSCYNRMIHLKTGSGPAACGKGAMVALKHRSGHKKQSTVYMRTTTDKNVWASLSSVRHKFCKDKYLFDLDMRFIHGRIVICVKSEARGGEEKLDPPHQKLLSSTCQKQ